MALPGGGIVSVPLHGDTSSEPGASGSNPHHPKALAPQGQGQPIPTTTVPGLDLLTVPAGEPVTHFNLVSAMWHYMVLYSSVLAHTMILSTCFYPKKLCFGLLFLHSIKFKCEWTTTIGGRQLGLSPERTRSPNFNSYISTTAHFPLLPKCVIKIPLTDRLSILAFILLSLEPWGGSFLDFV